MIDAQGYRANVGIVLCNEAGHLFWGRRVGQNAWQFPQGGIKRAEDAEAAMFRELHEEVGLRPDQVKVLARSSGWLRYRIPQKFVRRDCRPLCIGQKQAWFLLQLTGGDNCVCLDHGPRPEFEAWRWVDYWYPPRNVIAFKRKVYRLALSEFAPHLGKPLPAAGETLPRAAPQACLAV